MEKFSKAFKQANMSMDTHLDWEIIKIRASRTTFDTLKPVKRLARGSMSPCKGMALTTGCVGSECALKTELMDMDTLQWFDGPDYPFTLE